MAYDLDWLPSLRPIRTESRADQTITVFDFDLSGSRFIYRYVVINMGVERFPKIV